MLLLVSAAFLSVQAVFEKMGAARVIWRLLVSFVLLVLGLGAYQALAVYYIAACLILSGGGETGANRGSEQEQKDGRLLALPWSCLIFCLCVCGLCRYRRRMVYGGGGLYECAVGVEQIPGN